MELHKCRVCGSYPKVKDFNDEWFVYCRNNDCSFNWKHKLNGKSVVKLLQEWNELNYIDEEDVECM